jgi:ribonucleoside-diphosphate reductase alpha chain
MRRKFEAKVPKKVWSKSEDAVRSMGTMPSMRAFWAAGEALEKNNIIGYNCCSMVFKDLQSPVELFYILMCGAGVGFSIEKQFIGQMPAVARSTPEGVGVHVVGDSREGWALALKAGLEAWFAGKDIEFDVTMVRPRGARLKTMGGRASGPAPLLKLLDFVRNIVFQAAGRQLTSEEWLDIGNMIGEVVVVGGVRRSSEITFSDLEDTLIRDAKDFTKGPIPRHREMSNNSVCYNGRPPITTFMKEWASLAASGSGERGIFNLKAAMDACPRRAVVKSIGGVSVEWTILGLTLRTNPCGEINLLALMGQFCNLTEVVVRAEDTFATLAEKVKTAVWLGAMQSCLTDFPFIRPSFKEACEVERLLGVSLTGQMDNPKLMTADRLSDLKDVAIRECRKACKALGINMSAAITTGKPSGTVSQLVNCASGGHPRHAQFYIRRYRINATDPLYRMMKAQGVPFSPENGQGPEGVERLREGLTRLPRPSRWPPLRAN